jgi:fibro-slime domain-containing protein
MPRRTPLLLLALTIAGAAAACGGSPETTGSGAGSATSTTSASTGGAGGAGGEGGVLLPTTSSSAGGGAGGGQTSEPACGDGKVDPGEACDDGNAESSDGCTGTCNAIESGFACPVPGEACVSTVVCGDGKITGDETCDDQNTDAGDGCDASCHVELGWKCPVLGAACEAAACGDGIVAGQEQCEDGGSPPTSDDGCDEHCRLEPGFKCPNPGQACEPTTCGDALVEGSEQCDDGNHDMGDGCAPDCTWEPECPFPSGACTSKCGDGIRLPGGAEACEDGNTKSGDGCDSACKVEPGYQCTDVSIDATELVLPLVVRDFDVTHPDFETFGGSGPTLGMVQDGLGSDGKPVYNGDKGQLSSEASFNQWYRDVPDTNHTFVQTMTLGKLGTGEFQFDSPLFFPIDGLGFGNSSTDVNNQPRNFHFTSEVRYWFEYKSGQKLDFRGDDDVWVFINKTLAVDLGGLHPPSAGGVDLDVDKAKLGLEDGKIYEIVVFQAERRAHGSSYKLTLGNFVNVTSQCQSQCGDGVKTPDEACDEGAAQNDGAYGHCTVDCKRGPSCGDGVLQPEHEECDDGVNLSPYGGCAPGCKHGAFCGDGEVNSLFGEQCDDGVNDGSYGTCTDACALGPRCGDGVLQPEHEECDDGNKKNGDGCSNTCKLDKVN